MKLILITPCSRPQNLLLLHNSINFELVHKWYIVYDTSQRRSYKKEFPYHTKIEELECDDEKSCFGNAQRNKALDLCDEDAMIYFLDDDNIILPTFWDIIENDIKKDTNYADTFYTFNQHRISEGRILAGNKIEVNHIDTGMFIVPKRLIGDIRWMLDAYNADGFFIVKVSKQNPDKHKYIDKCGSYYNFLNICS